MLSSNPIETFEKTNKWIEQIQNKSQADIPILLVGNKADLEVERAISELVGSKKAEDQGKISIKIIVNISYRNGIL